jgi:hypothetical protein
MMRPLAARGGPAALAGGRLNAIEADGSIGAISQNRHR